MAEPACKRIFERIKHRIVIVLVSEYTLLLSFLNVSSVIPRGKHHFTQQMDFGKTVNLTLFIAEPCSVLNRCFEQLILENHN